MHCFKTDSMCNECFIVHLCDGVIALLAACSCSMMLYAVFWEALWQATTHAGLTSAFIAKALC